MACDAYFKVRRLGGVQVIRGPDDTDEVYGSPHDAEDIPLPL